MKPLISYYGGKQRMVHNLLPLIPEHKIYVEPFCGGASLFFAKDVPVVSNNDHYREVLNDTSGELVNLYRVVQGQSEEFKKKLLEFPYSEEVHILAKNKTPANDVERAVFYFMNIMMSFSYKINGGFAFGKMTQNNAKTYFNKLTNIDACIKRMQGVYIFHRDALDVIKRFDCEDAFFYCDPPYPGTHQGHYEGYTQDDFSKLLNTLDGIKGSFLLSCYENDAVPDDWEKIEFKASCSVNNVNKRQSSQRTECVWRKRRS